jgi:hypothetical protein
MPNSSSSKYVKRRAHRRTKSRRHAKKYTVKKVMRGCSSKQSGGAPPLGNSAVGGNGNKVEVPVTPGTSNQHSETNAAGAAVVLKAQAFTSGSGTPKAFPNTATQTGGYKSKHRRRRYKKSIGRKGRSRRFRGSRK